MRRAYSSYSEQEFRQVSQKAESLGLSFSAYQRYCVLSSLDQTTACPVGRLVDKMFQNLEKMAPGCQFIVSELLPEEWLSLSRSEKMTMAKQLAARVRSDPRFAASARAGKTTIYKRS